MAVRRYAFLYFAVLCVGANSGRAQVTISGSITGVVTDTSGAVIAGATVTATNINTQVSTSTVTNSTGLYTIYSLIPGTYTVAVEQTGFSKFVRENVVVSVDTVVRVDATLKVGPVTQQVTVSGAAPMLKTDKADVSLTISDNNIEKLPVLGRNFTRLVALAPGASYDSGQLFSHPENAGEDYRVSVNGQYAGNSYRQLDGVDNNETIQGLSMVVAPADAVQELKLTTSNYDAEFGQVSGAVIQVSTKSGTNDFHGSLFEFYRSNGMFARNPFSEPVKPASFVWHQFGGSAGGPIRKDKLFFFGDFQGMRSSLGGSSLYTSPLQAFRSGDFSSLAKTNPIYDPMTGNPDGTGRTQFLNNIIPPGRIDPAAANLLALVPPPTDSTKTDDNYTVSRPGSFDQNQFDSRIDYNVSSKSRLFGRYSLFRSSFYTDNVFGPIAGGPPVGGIPNSGQSSTQSQALSVGYSRTFSPSLLTDVRFGLGRLRIDEYQLDKGLNTMDKVGIPGVNMGTIYTTGSAQFDISGPVSSFSMGDFGLPFLERETSIDVVNNWTKAVGNHSFKWGADIKKAFANRTDKNGRGDFGFSQNLTGNPAVPGSGLGLASFLLGLTSGYTRNVTTDIRQEKQWRDGIYAQDTWAVNRNLSLMLGVRWNYFSPIFSGPPGSISNLDTNLGVALVNTSSSKYVGVEPVHNEFDPRIGLTYRVNSNTVVRAGYGRSHAIDVYGAQFGTQAAVYPIVQSQSFSQTTQFTPISFTLSDGPPALPPLPSVPANGQVPFPDGTFMVYPGTGPFPHTYVDSWNLAIQHMLGSHTTVELAYVGNVGRDEWSGRDANAAVPGPGPLNPRKPFYNQFGWTQYLLLRRAMLSSDYNGLQARIQKNFSNGFSAVSTFAWSKSIDQGTFGTMNWFDMRSDFGPSDNNRDLVSTTAFTWELPFGPGKPIGANATGIARQLIGGWSVNGIVNLESGAYFTPVMGDNSSLSSPTVTLRPDRNGSGDVPNPTRNLWFDPTAFTRPAPFVYGNSGRNILRGPGLAVTDLSLFKGVKLTERINLELRWETFNTFNRTNMSNPATAIDTSVAGQITSTAYPMRRMQIGAHLAW
jgi:outer membrane receptor protein involved in Fe transport